MAPLRNILLLGTGLLSGFIFFWAIRLAARPGDFRLPRAYTEIFRSTSVEGPLRIGSFAGKNAPSTPPAPRVPVAAPKAGETRAARLEKRSAVAVAAMEEEEDEEAAQAEEEEKEVEEAPPSPSRAPVKKLRRGKVVKGVIPPPPPSAAEDLPRVTIKPAGATTPVPKLWKSEAAVPEFCEGVERYPEDEVEWHQLTYDEVDLDAHPCHLANITHWALKHYYRLGVVKICTHDPTVDTVISDHLHKWSFWGSPDEWMVLLAAGPCTAERPYMLDIGSNLGVFTLIGAERGCHAVAFEPLSENIHRLSHSVKVNGFEDRVILMQHAVGKYFTEVTIGFRPSNPGASGINLGGSKSELVQQITIDGLLASEEAPAFKDAKEKGLPPLSGQYINFVKVDTEGYDVAVVEGMLHTFVEGRVPLMLIEFGPGDAAGTAGCDPAQFVEVMYENGYSLWEWGYRVPLETLTNINIPVAINGAFGKAAPKGAHRTYTSHLSSTPARHWPPRF